MDLVQMPAAPECHSCLHYLPRPDTGTHRCHAAWHTLALYALLLLLWLDCVQLGRNTMLSRHTGGKMSRCRVLSLNRCVAEGVTKQKHGGQGKGVFFGGGGCRCPSHLVHVYACTH